MADTVAVRNRPEGRGRDAEVPADIPREGWRDILIRVRRKLSQDYVSLVAAGLAFYALFAIFPGLAAVISLYGLFASPEQVVKHMEQFTGVLPPGAWEILGSRLKDIASRGQQTLTLGVAIGLLIALWSARSGMSNLITAINIAYSEPEKRGFIKQTFISLVFTFVAVIGFIAVLLLGVAVPLVLAIFGAHPWVQTAAGVLRWVLLWVVVSLGLSLVYRFAPSRNPARWKWVSWGSGIAATLWLLGSLLFALYVRNFASYGKTYGALGGVIVLLMWFYISSYVVVLGAEINAEMERQTARDTTRRPPKPMGERGAYVADTLGPTP